MSGLAIVAARGTLIPDDPQEDRHPKHDHQEDQVVHESVAGNGFAAQPRFLRSVGDLDEDSGGSRVSDPVEHGSVNMELPDDREAFRGQYRESKFLGERLASHRDAFIVNKGRQTSLSKILTISQRPFDGRQGPTPHPSGDAVVSPRKGRKAGIISKHDHADDRGPVPLVR